MADVEKLNINSTDYDIADAKALRNKDTVGANSFIDTRAGTTTYPTDIAHTNSIIIGDKAYISSTNIRDGVTIVGNGAYANLSYSTVVGNMAHANGSQTVSIGYNANAGGNQATAIGNNATANAVLGVAIGRGATINSGNYSILIGSDSGLSGRSSIAMGYNTSISSDYSIAFGRGATVGSNSSYSVAIGYAATASNNSGHSLALGSGARTIAYYAAQIGEGTNGNYGSLQFRGWPLVNGNGKIYEERLPEGIKTATPRFPNLYNTDEEKVSEQAVLYTGPENDIFKSDTFYFGRVRYGYPRFRCSWVDSDWLDSQNDVMIDQQKFFTKLAEITKQRIDNNDVANGVIGGDNAEMSIYLKYDADNDYYFLDFDSDSFEKAFNGQSDDITGLSFDDLADYGIYFRNFHKPSDLEGEYEFCDIYYYAPAYIDSYDWNNNPSYINYFQFLSALNDGDYGIGVVIPNYNYWEYEVDGTTYYCPIIPKTYEWNGDEYDGVEFRWEWDDNDGKWVQYINGNASGYSFTTAKMYTTFGIKIDEGEESNIEYVGLTVRGAEQRYWEEVDYAKQEDLDALSEQVAPLYNWRVQEKTGKSYDFNDFRTPGWYYFPNATMFTHKPTNMGIGCMLLVQKNVNNYISQHVFAAVPSHNWNGSSYMLNSPAIFSRVYNKQIWGNWNMYMTTGTMADLIPGFDATKKQYLTHSANSINIEWADA